MVVSRRWHTFETRSNFGFAILTLKLWFGLASSAREKLYIKVVTHSDGMAITRKRDDEAAVLCG